MAGGRFPFLFSDKGLVDILPDLFELRIVSPACGSILILDPPIVTFVAYAYATAVIESVTLTLNDGTPVGMTHLDGNMFMVVLYTGYGTHTQTVTATDTLGQTATASCDFTVVPPPEDDEDCFEAEPTQTIIDTNLAYHWSYAGPPGQQNWRWEARRGSSIILLLTGPGTINQSTADALAVANMATVVAWYINNILSNYENRRLRSAEIGHVLIGGQYRPAYLITVDVFEDEAPPYGCPPYDEPGTPGTPPDVTVVITSGTESCGGAYELEGYAEAQYGINRIWYSINNDPDEELYALEGEEEEDEPS